MTSTSSTGTAVRAGTVSSALVPSSGPSIVLRPLDARSWIATDSGRFAGSIRFEGDYLAFDAEGMLIGTTASLDAARAALVAPGTGPVSYSTRLGDGRAAVSSGWRLLSGLGVAAALAGCCGTAVALLR